MRRLRLTFLSVLLLVAPVACGGDDDDAPDAGVQTGLDRFLPDIPAPTGEEQTVYAGAIDEKNAAAELLPGDAASGVVGDLYIRNARGRFIVQAADRVIGVVPQGGNLVDVLPVGPDGPIGEDHFGELGAMYLLGRTCEPDRVEVVQDGSDGGVAAIVARGVAAPNDFINIKGLGVLPVTQGLDPDIPDSVECATTYILAPDSSSIEVHWTFFNGGQTDIRGPFAAFSDTGGNVEVWAPERGFERIGIDDLGTVAAEAPVDYAVYQGPGVAYGVIPQHADPAATNASFIISGVSVVLFGADQLIDIFEEEEGFFNLPAGDGVTHAVHVVAGQDASDVAEAVAAASPDEFSSFFGGSVVWDNGEPVEGARVGVFRDEDRDGVLDPTDVVLTYMDTDANGEFEGIMEPAGLDLLLRADLPDRARSEVIPSPKDITVPYEFILDRPIRQDYEIVDDDTNLALPAKLLVIGENPVAADERLHGTFDRFPGFVAMIQAVRGTSTDVGDGEDPPILLAPDADYRVLVSHGTEWSVADAILSPLPGQEPDPIQFRLRRVVDTSGYVASEYHVHSIGSPDSIVPWPTRVATAVADGVEVFASTEHDYVADLQPLVENLGLDRQVRALPGIEVTPFAYGHFNAWPLEPLDSPNRGAIDWARGAGGFALVPGEIFGAMQSRGAELVEVNHPRAAPGAFSDFQAYFDRAGLTFDYDQRTIFGQLQPVPNEDLRLPAGSEIMSTDFNALEVWNGFGLIDSDQDGAREIRSLDLVMRDWFNFLSFGLSITPLGNSDTHTIVRDPMGMPRTLVAVDDDSPEALEDGSVVDPLLATLKGETPRDLVVTNGPHIRVVRAGETGSAIGRVLAAVGGQVELAISVQSASWAEFDVIEVFANAIPELASDLGMSDPSSLRPVKCFVTVPPATLNKNDPCASAALPPEQISVDRVVVANGIERYQTSLALTLQADDPIHPDGGTGQDAWVVVRARGNRGIYPLLLNEVLTDENLPTLLTADQDAIDELLVGIGVPASAFTAPIYLDLDGGGYRAPFAPE